MKKQDKTAEEKTVRNTGFKWWIIASLIAIISVVLMLMSAGVTKEKAAERYHVNNSFCGGDFALFVAMPLLNMIVK